MKLAAMGRLTASIAHEVRNPLSAINQAAQLLEEDALVAPGGRAPARHDPQQRASASTASSARCCSSIAATASSPRPSRSREFMRSLIDEIVQAENMPPGARRSCRFPTTSRVMFDRGHLNQIVWNLVRNAWQHCQKKEGSIRDRRARGLHGRRGDLRAADDGPGIPAELRGQIFEPFFTTRPGGTGLGLYIARELADANGAALELLPTGPGAHFRMTLKRAATDAERSAAD